MKKLSLLLVLTLLAGCLLPACLLPASAQEIPHPYGITYPISGQFGSNHTFTLEQNGTMTIVGKGPMIGNEGYEFPWSVAAGDVLFDFRNHVKRVVVQPGSTTVGENAFAPFYELEEVSLPQGIVSIENGAFTDCKALETIDLPESVTSIGDGAFGGCEKLTGVRLPANLTYLGGSAFAGTAVTDVKLPAGLTHLGGQAFYDTPWYRAQPDGMIYLNSFAYAYKGDMPENTEITLKPGTKHLCELAFFDHPDTIGQTYQPHLTGLILPDSITELEPYQFENLAGLRRLTLPKGISSLPENMCQGCYALEEVTIPDGVTEIGSRAFWECAALEEITIPEGVRTVGEDAFSGCKSLTSVSLPDSVTTLGGRAFSGCEALAEVTLGEGVTAIPNGAFKFCPALKEMTLPDSVTEIGPWAFSDCPGLETVRIPVSVKKIGNGAFPPCYSVEEEPRLTVVFGGTEEQWRAVEINPDDNKRLTEASVVFAGGTPRFCYGDVDGDGEVKAADARLVLRASVKLEQIGEGTDRYRAADVDFDGSLSAADARLVLRISVHLDEPPAGEPAVVPPEVPQPQEELSELLLNGGLFEVRAGFASYESVGVGFAVDDGKTLVCRWSLIHHADRISVTRSFFDGTVETFKVVGVEGIDAVNDLVLLRLNNPGKAMELLRTDPPRGEKAYYFGERSSDACTSVDPDSADAFPEDPFGRKILSFYDPVGPYDCESGTPFLDRSGRVIGLWLARNDQGNGCVYATPAAAVEAIDRSHPMTVTEFKKVDRAPGLVGGYQDVTVLPHATVFIPVLVDSYEAAEPTVKTSRPDLLKVSLARTGPELYVVIVRVLKPCQEVTVTVSVHTSYGDAAVTSVISTSEDAYLNLVGYPVAADPGALWEITPSDVWIGEDDGIAHLQFPKKSFSHSDEDMLNWYAGVLLANGFAFSYTEEEPDGDGWCYVFNQTEGEAVIRYHDCSTYVEIEIADPY